MTPEPDWKPAAAALADQVTLEAEAPEWRDAVAATPRHLLVPAWWQRIPSSPHQEWERYPADDADLFERAYSDVTLVTRAGTLHADHAEWGDRAQGEPTSSSTLPGLIVPMLHLLDPQPEQDHVLDIGTGSGYSAALLAHRVGDHLVTSIDLDPYLVDAARRRLRRFGRTPRFEARDATGQVPTGAYTRIMATVSARPIPAAWLDVLAPGGRIVTTIAGTTLLITAEMDVSGIAHGRVVSDAASFMPTRDADDYPPRLQQVYATARDTDGDDICPLSGPVPDLWGETTVRNLYELDTPGIEVRSADLPDGRQLSWLLAADGSWARLVDDGTQPMVHQAGPRRLWDRFEHVRDQWEQHDRFPLTECTIALRPHQSTLTTPAGRTYPI